MPTYNRVALLERMLEPLLAEPDALEVVVVVDGCEDGSLELLQSMAQHDSRLRPARIDNSGMGEARTAGARAASGEVVLLIDDDVLLEPGIVRGHARVHAAAQGLAGDGRVRGQPLRVAGYVVLPRRHAVAPGAALLRGRRDEALRRGALPVAQRGPRGAQATGWNLAGLADLL